MFQLLVVASTDDASLVRAALEPLQSESDSQFISVTENGLGAVRERLWDAVILTVSHVAGVEAVPLESYVDLAHGAPIVIVGRDLGEDGTADLILRGAVDVVSFGRLARLPLVLMRELRRNQSIVAHQQSSKTAHSWFVSIINHIPIGIAYHNERGKVVLCNQTALDLLGLTEDEYLGRSPFDPRWNICGENGEPIASPDLPVAQALRTKQPVRDAVIGIFRPKTNDRVWVRVDAIPVLDSAGGLAHVVAKCSDISEELRISEDLRTSEERFRSAFEHSGVGMMLMSLDARVVQVNETVCRYFGFAREDLLDKTMAELTHPDDVALSLEYIDVIMSRKKPSVALEKRYRHASGHYWWGSASAAMVPDALGKPAHYVLVIHDITARKQAELERVQLEAQLIQARKFEALGALAGAVAHDFNNILAAILCSADVLLHDLRQLPSAGELPEIVFEMQHAANRGADLVRQILTFSRRNNQRRNKLKLEITIEETLELIKKTLPGHINLRFVARAKPSIMADTTQIQQALLNLCKMALYGIDDKSSLVTIELNSVVIDAAAAKSLGTIREGLHAHLRVHDNGPIIDPETLEHIAEPLYTTKSTGKGSGLGMAVVHGIVMNHDGAIQIQSSRQAGTTVDVWIPAIPRETNERAPVKSPIPQGQNEQILIVDDEESLARVFGRLLQGIGYKATVHTHPVKALESFEKDPSIYHAALVDLHMPALGGIDVAKRLHAIRPTMPIFIMSGYSDAIGDTPLENIGVVGILQKPITRDALAAELRTALDRHSQTSA